MADIPFIIISFGTFACACFLRPLFVVFTFGLAPGEPVSLHESFLA
jgi:hypothetical protein